MSEGHQSIARWPHGGTMMAERVRAYDWAATSLGSPERWPTELRSVLDLALASPQVASVVVGAERVLLYNDAAAALYGNKHPQALGRPLPETWPEAWAEARRHYDRVFAGESVHVPVQALDLERSGAGQVFEAYLTPVRDAHGTVIAAHMAGFEIGARLRVEAALRENEGKYRSLFESVNQGLAINQLVRDEDGRGVDARFLDLNPAHEAQAGVSRASVVGHLASEVVPFLGRAWFEMAERVVETGQAERYETFVPGLDRWFAFDMARFQGRDLFVVLYADITERKRVEAVLRESEERQAFLLNLSDALRPMDDPIEIKAVAARLLGEQLGVNRSMYAEVDDGTWVLGEGYVHGVAPVPAGRYPVTSYGVWMVDAFAAGRPVTVQNVRTDERYTADEQELYAGFEVIGYAGVPLVKAERLAAILIVHTATPKLWLDQEIALIQEAAERTWAAVERARAEAALRESEERHRSLFVTISEGFTLGEVVRDAAGNAVDWRLLELNPVFEEYTGKTIAECVGRTTADVFGAVDPYWLAVYDHAVRTRQAERTEAWFGPIDRWVGVGLAGCLTKRLPWHGRCRCHTSCSWRRSTTI